MTSEKEIKEPGAIYVRLGVLVEYVSQFGISRDKLLQLRKQEDFPKIRFPSYKEDRYDWREVHKYLKLS